MSYSRWGSSRWYTYWTSAPEHDNKKQWQKFVICDFAKTFEFTYKELSLNIEKILDEVCDYHSKAHTVKMLKDWSLKSKDYEEVEIKPDPVSQAERDELKGYMLQFLKDMDNEFKKKKRESKA
jgi:hypothetical protein